MQSDKHFFDDISKSAGSAFQLMIETKEQINNLAKKQAELFLSGLDLPTREEIDVVKEMAASTIKKQDEILSRIESIEKKLNMLEKSKRSSTKKKSNNKSSSKK